jgi:hypothetical protein
VITLKQLFNKPQHPYLKSNIYIFFSTGSYVEVFHHKLQRNELILKDELRLLLHLCQSVGDMVTAKDAIYRYNLNTYYNVIKHKKCRCTFLFKTNAWTQRMVIRNETYGCACTLLV